MPIHLIWGDDIGAIDKSIEKLIKSTIDENWINMNLSRLEGKNPNKAHQALEEAQTPPLGSGERIIILQNSPICNGCSNDLMNHFNRVINLIPDTTHLILKNQSKPDNRLKTTKAIKALIKSNKAIERYFLLPTIWDIKGQKKLVQGIANDMKIKLKEEALIAIVDALGNDSQRIELELQKLLLLEEAKTKNNSSDEVIIHEESVHELIQEISSNSIQICNHLLSESYGLAIHQIDYLLNKGEPSLRILATFTSQIRGLLWVSLLEKEEIKEVNFVAKQAGIANPKRIYVMRKQIQGRSPEFFIELLKRILKIEVLLKKGIPPKDAFREGLLTKA